MKLIAFLLLIPAIAAYSIGQLVQHGKIRWSKDVFGFWGEESDRRKYHRKPRTPGGGYWITAAGHLLDLANTERLNKTLEYYEKKVQSLKAELQEKDRQLRELQPQPLTNEPSASNA